MQFLRASTKKARGFWTLARPLVVNVVTRIHYGSWSGSLLKAPREEKTAKNN